MNTNLELVFPQGEFKQSMDRLGVGIQLNGFYRFPNTIFGLGLDFGFKNFGVDSRDEPIAKDTNFDDWAFAWGGGTGVMIKVYDQRGKEAQFAEDGSEAHQTVGYVNIGVRYLYGQEAEYLKQGSIGINNGTLTYATSRSKTDMMIWQLGFVLQF